MAQQSPFTARLAKRRDLARSVRDVLRCAIIAGDFAHGELPNEDDLREDFSTSRNVIREAFAMLRNEGLIERVQGAGTFAVAHRVRQRAELMESLAESIGADDGRVDYRMLRSELVPAPRIVAVRLALPAGAMTVLIERLTLVDGEPIQLTTRYVPADRVLPLLAARDADVPWYRLGYLEDALGIAMSESTLSVQAVAADESVSEILRCPVGLSLLLVERVVVGDDGTPFEFGMSHFRGDRYVLNSTLADVRSSHGPTGHSAPGHG